jgi:signal transduction histidine kinase/ABC-type uncharacterized transport system substrate-binding protein
VGHDEDRARATPGGPTRARPTPGLRPLGRVLAVVGLVLAPATAGVAAPAEMAQRNVVLLYAASRLLPANVEIDMAVRDTLKARAPHPVYFYTEYLDSTLLEGDAEEDLARLLQRRYARVRVDVVVPVGSGALRFAAKHRRSLFPAAPVVYLGIGPSPVSGPDITGVWVAMGWVPTLELVRRLQPEVRRAVVPVGTAAVDRSMHAEARAELREYGGGIAVEFLEDLPLDAIVQRVAALDDQTVVIAGTYLRDGTGRDLVPAEAVARIARSARVPVYALSESLIGTGVLGGHVVRFHALGVRAAEVVLAVLRGERPPPAREMGTVDMVDWRELARRGIDEGRLPSSTLVRFRPASAWEQHRGLILAGAVGLLVQGTLIAALVVQRAQRRRVQLALNERLRFETLLSELSSRFIDVPPGGLDTEIERALGRLGQELAVDQASLMQVEAGRNMVRMTHVWSARGAAPVPQAAEIDGFPWVAARLFQGQAVHFATPDELPPAAARDRRNFEARATRSLAVVPLVVEGAVMGGLSLNTLDGRRAWPDELVVRLRLVGQVFANALARRRAETAIREREDALRRSHGRVRDLARRLISAQEEERRRISRELHDDLNQEIAAVAIALSALRRSLAPGEARLAERMAAIHQRTAGLADRVRRLSHELHPAVLEHAGLAVALRAYCAAFHADTDVEVGLDLEPRLEGLPADAALCLYRVTQEALRNVARHSGARRAEVVVRRVGNAIALTVCDRGVGFEPAAERGGGGLGLASMEERVRLVGGSVEVRSAPGQGTQVIATVPFASPAAADAPLAGVATDGAHAAGLSRPRPRLTGGRPDQNL